MKWLSILRIFGLVWNKNCLLGILSIVGKQRSGKSYFINKVILDSNEFQVGNTVNACTRGLVLMKQVLEAKNNKHNNLAFLVIDSEGIGNPNSNINADSKIFLLSLLLSSLFVFNSMYSFISLGILSTNSLSKIYKSFSTWPKT